MNKNNRHFVLRTKVPVIKQQLFNFIIVCYIIYIYILVYSIILLFVLCGMIISMNINCCWCPEPMPSGLAHCCRCHRQHEKN